jgi:hypothetical protein
VLGAQLGFEIRIGNQILQLAYTPVFKLRHLLYQTTKSEEIASKKVHYLH